MSETNTVSPLRQRMIEDMAARKLNSHTQRSHIYSCKRFGAWLKRSPDTATADEVLTESQLAALEKAKNEKERPMARSRANVRAIAGPRTRSTSAT